MTYDVVIRNGLVVDGSGAKSYRADVGISGGRIAEIGRLADRGKAEVDAEEAIVTPGFIDGHTHMDAQLFWDSAGSWSCYHGVTSVVMGNCGFTLAPSSEDEAELVIRNFERAEDIPAAALHSGIRWAWTSFAEFLQVVDSMPKTLNYAANIGHSALRTHVMGERAFEETATPDDLARMDAELRDAMRAGAFGFTSSRSHHHETADGRPVASRLASEDELAHLVEVAAEEGGTLFQWAYDQPSPDEKSARINWIMDLAARTRMPFALAAVGRNAPPALETIDAVASAGGRAFGVTHPRGIGALCSFRTQLPFDRIPEWQSVRALPEEAQAAALRDPEVRRQLVVSANEAKYLDGIGGEPRPPDFNTMRVLLNPIPPNPSVAELASERRMDPIEVMIEVTLERDFDVFFWQPISPVDKEALPGLLRDPRIVLGFSDAGAHVGQMADHSIYTHVLGYLVRQQGTLGIEEAVQMMTSRPAQAWGLPDRGLIKVGLSADMNVIEPDRVTPEMPTLCHDLPGGGTRVKQLSKGIRATLVDGQVVVKDGVHTNALPGSLLQRGRVKQSAQ